MFDTEGLKISVGASSNPYRMSEREESYRRNVNLRPPTLEKVLKWIDEQALDKEVAVEMKKIASKYPTHALSQFLKNYRNLLNKTQKKVLGTGVPINDNKETTRTGKRPEGKFHSKKSKDEDNPPIS